MNNDTVSELWTVIQEMRETLDELKNRIAIMEHLMLAEGELKYLENYNKMKGYT